MIKMIIDGTNLIVGRMASVAAQKALLGEEIHIVNCEKLVISGGKQNVLAKAKQTRDRGVPLQGPYISRSPVNYVKRMIRGMLPYKQAKGLAAFKRIKCHKGIPAEFKDQKAETIAAASADKLPNLKYVSIATICKHLGSKE